MAGETTFCPNCGKANPIGMRFCGHCGAALAAPAETSGPEIPRTSSDTDIEPTQKLDTTAASPSVSAEIVTPAPAAIPAPATPSILAVPKVKVVVPADPIARERERDRLLSLATVQRMRAQILDARASLQKAIILSEGMPGPQVAPIHEMLGDMLAAEERWEQAAASYEQAQALDPARASAERKFGEMTLRIADEKAMAKLGGMVRSGSGDAITSGSQGKRNPGFAMILSLIVPGFGQFYNGQFIKACVCLGVFVIAMFLITLTPDIKAIRCLLIPGTTTGCRGLTIAPLTWFCILAAAGAWLFSLIDAPIAASKTQDMSIESGPVVDKSGWEV
jgi:hypothetical protein